MKPAHFPVKMRAMMSLLAFGSTQAAAQMGLFNFEPSPLLTPLGETARRRLVGMFHEYTTSRERRLVDNRLSFASLQSRTIAKAVENAL